jgi:hypothetical protein
MPVMAIAICALCIGAGMATIENKRIRRRVSFWLGVTSFVLMVWGVGIIHETGYVGNPGWAAFVNRMQKIQFEQAQDVVRDWAKKYPSVKLPAGWIEDACIGDDGKKVFSFPPRFHSASVGSYWHTGITGVYKLSEQTMGMWCPGGTAEECATLLELRQIGE